MVKLKRVRFKNIMYSLPKNTLIVGHISCLSAFIEGYEELIDHKQHKTFFEYKVIHFTDFSPQYPATGIRKPDLIIYSDKRDLANIKMKFMGNPNTRLIYMLLNVRDFK